MDILHSMKDALMKYETIDVDQIDDLMERKEEIREPKGWSDQTTESKDNKAEDEKNSDTNVDDSQENTSNKE